MHGVHVNTGKNAQSRQTHATTEEHLLLTAMQMDISGKCVCADQGVFVKLKNERIPRGCGEEWDRAAHRWEDGRVCVFLCAIMGAALLISKSSV